MWKYCLLLLAVFGCATFSGCGGDLKPKPLTAEQERKLERQMQKVQEVEAAHFAQEASGDSTDAR